MARVRLNGQGLAKVRAALRPPARAKTAAPAPDAFRPLLESGVRELGAEVQWAPPSDHTLSRMPEKGREIEAHFAEGLSTSLKGLAVEPGRSMVVIPARNEEKYLAQTLSHALASLDGAEGTELSLVNNASTDRTLDEARAWAAAHADRVVLIDHTQGAPDGAVPAGKLGLHLFDENQPGKVNALLKVKELFAARGRYPEWVVQLDADTNLEPQLVDRAIALTEERGLVAATGMPHARRRDGSNQPPFKMAGISHRWDGLFGQFIVARTPAFVAGYEAIRDVYPQAATEDALLSAIFRMAGFDTGSAEPLLPYETLAASTQADARSQNVRWLTGGLQARDVFDWRELSAHHLYTNPFQYARTFVREHWREPKTLLREARLVKNFLSVYRDARKAARRANRAGRYSWVPPRSTESTAAQCARIVKELKATPVRDLRKDPKAWQYLAEHPVYVSLTTSPQRIEHVRHVLDSLDLTHVTRVLLVLPERFGRTGEPYEIPDELLRHPKLQIVRIPEDLGPITKVLPAIEVAKAHDPDALVLSVDDDVGYPRGMVAELIHALANSENTVVAGSSPALDFWNIDPTLWPRPSQPGGDVVEGFAGIGYRAKEVDTGLMLALSQLSTSTFGSDDLVISYALAHAGVETQRVESDYYRLDQVRPFPYGFGEDALHQLADAGLPENPHATKYRQAAEQMDRVLEPQASASAPT